MYHYKFHFWLRLSYYQTIDKVFLKTSRKSIFVANGFFRYFHVFDEEILNPLKSLSDSIHVKTHLI